MKYKKAMGLFRNDLERIANRRDLTIKFGSNLFSPL
jgi:hypothetical protein